MEQGTVGSFKGLLFYAQPLPPTSSLLNSSGNESRAGFLSRTGTLRMLCKPIYRIQYCARTPYVCTYPGSMFLRPVLGQLVGTDGSDNNRPRARASGYPSGQCDLPSDVCCVAVLGLLQKVVRPAKKAKSPWQCGGAR